MDQPSLFYEDIYDALKAVVNHLGGAKLVGAALWPDKSPESAARLLLDCCNVTRAERLNPEQVLLLLKKARAAGFHGLKHFIDSEAGYTRTAPMDPADEAIELQRAFVESVKAQRVMLERLDRLGVGLKIVA